MARVQRNVRRVAGTFHTGRRKIHDHIKAMKIALSRARSSENLGFSRTQAQRALGHLEYDNNKLATVLPRLDIEESDIETFISSGESDHGSSDYVETAIDESEADESEADESRIEAMGDPVTENRALVLQNNTKAGNSQARNAARFTAIQQPLAERDRHHRGATFILRGRKRQRMREGNHVPDLEAAVWAQIRRDEEPRNLSNDQRNKLAKLTKLRTLTEGILDRLVPCPDGGLWDAELIFERFRMLWDTRGLSIQATRLAENMDAKQSRGWFCVRRMAVDGTNSVAFDGECRSCKNPCVQLKPVDENQESEDNRYYARVMDRQACQRAVPVAVPIVIRDHRRRW